MVTNSSWPAADAAERETLFLQPQLISLRASLDLELKLIADVGFVGEPNAGKSTLLSVISAAQPRIADYPFTTLAPNLGVAQLSDHRTFVAADIPGIIEGAHQGKGLGLQFLRHIERTRMLCFLIPVNSHDAQTEFDMLRRDLLAYSRALAEKPYCVVFSKMDLGGGEPAPLLSAPGALAVLSLSAAARTGIDEFKERIWSLVQQISVPDTSDSSNADRY
jgi:GTP-binding protein